MEQPKTDQLCPVDRAPSRLLRKADFAKLMEVTPGYVSQLIHKGLPVEPNGRIDPDKGRAWWDANLGPGRRKPRDGAQGTLARLKAEIDAERLKHLRIETAERERRLVDRDAARREVLAAARAERDAHLAWVMRTSPVLAAELGVDAGRMFTALDREMREHLRQLSETPLKVLE